MSRVLVTQIFTYCDVCKYDGRQEIPANPEDAILFEIQGRPKRVDVCENDRNPSWETITACMIDDIDPDRKVPVQIQTADRAFTCPICHEPRADTAQGLSTHMSKKHKDIQSIERHRLWTETVGPENVSAHARQRFRNPAIDPCPVKGCAAVVAGPQGLRMHVKIAHEEVSPAQREKWTRALHASKQLELEAPAS
jgi:hypothetical protein